MNISSTLYEVKKKVNGKIFDSYQIDIYGKENLEKWLYNIGFSNTKHLTKIEIWRKLGYCPPRTTYKERFVILNSLNEKNL